MSSKEETRECKRRKKDGFDIRTETGVSALKVVAAHEEGEEIQRLRAENKALKGALDAIIDQAGENHTYYDRLVWKARRGDHGQQESVPDLYDRLKKDLGNDVSAR